MSPSARAVRGAVRTATSRAAAAAEAAEARNKTRRIFASPDSRRKPPDVANMGAVARGLRQLGPLFEGAAYGFCERMPERCAYIAGWISEGGLSRNPLVPRAWLLAEMADGQIAGLVYVSSTGIVMPVLDSDAALESVVEMARANQNAMRVLVGE